jgi:hypothetical protein
MHTKIWTQLSENPFPSRQTRDHTHTLINCYLGEAFNPADAYKRSLSQWLPIEDHTYKIA